MVDEFRIRCDLRERVEIKQSEQEGRVQDVHEDRPCRSGNGRVLTNLVSSGHLSAPHSALIYIERMSRFHVDQPTYIPASFQSDVYCLSYSIFSFNCLCKSLDVMIITKDSLSRFVERGLRFVEPKRVSDGCDYGMGYSRRPVWYSENQEGNADGARMEHTFSMISPSALLPFTLPRSSSYAIGHSRTPFPACVSGELQA